MAENGSREEPSPSVAETEPPSAPSPRSSPKAVMAECVALVHESTTSCLPPSLDLLASSIGGEAASDSGELAFVVLYVLMAETGFVPVGEASRFRDSGFEVEKLKACPRLPDGWTDQTLCRADFALPPFPDACELLCVKYRDELVASIFVGSMNFTQSINLARYVALPSAKPLAMKYRNLGELSVVFKDAMALPAKTAILRANRVAPPAHIQSLPAEMLYSIASYLDVRSYLHLEATCKHARQCLATFSKNLWRSFYQRDFVGANEPEDGPAEVNWRQKYREHYQNEIIQDRNRERWSAYQSVGRWWMSIT